MTNYKNANAFSGSAVDDRIRKALERVDAQSASDKRAELWVLHQQLCNSFELVKEGSRQRDTCLFVVESGGSRQLILGLWMKRVGH